MGTTQPDAKVVHAKGAHVALVAIGALLVIAAIAVGIGGRIGGTTVTKSGDGKTTTTKSWPSDAQFNALVGAGAALILAGFLWTRITAIKLPGGAEVDLSSDERQQAADAVAKALPPNTDNKTVAAATQKADSQLRQKKAQSGTTTISASDIASVVGDAVKEFLP
jgi:hypothetical protein